MSSLAVWSKFATMGRDGIHLVRALATGLRKKTPARPILLEHARQSNSAAVSLLKVDKQIGLIQYHGLSGYLKQRFQFQSTLLPDAAKNHPVESTNKGARVAFMVTTAMRTELTDRLGYDADQIKKLTPMQVSLILHHNVAPATMEQELPNLMQAHQEVERVRQQEAEIVRREEAQVLRQEEEERAARQQPQLEDADPREFAEEKMVQQYSDGSSSIQSTGGYMSVNLLGLDKNCLTSGFADNWFEVTETKDGVVSRVGLYVDQEEADLGCSTRQWIANRNEQLLIFKVNKISAESLM
jgi:hypothetical protein